MLNNPKKLHVPSWANYKPEMVNERAPQPALSPLIALISGHGLKEQKGKWDPENSEQNSEAVHHLHIIRNGVNQKTKH